MPPREQEKALSSKRDLFLCFDRRGIPLYLERRPGEIGLAHRIIEHILTLEVEQLLDDNNPHALSLFRDCLVKAYGLAGKPPVLILDQIDDFLRNSHLRTGFLAQLGPLLACTVSKIPGLDDFPCRWVLSCRQDFHGELSAWLQDVLLQARESGRTELANLPSDLKVDDRFHDYGLPLIGQPTRDVSLIDSAESAFLAAIRKPLTLLDNDTKRYRIIFENDGDKLLARAFARARHRRPQDALLTELQIVLHHLLECGVGTPEGLLVKVPLEASELDQTIIEALHSHLRRALERAFPLERSTEFVKQGRARALFGLT